jgi:hypothetical protein
MPTRSPHLGSHGRVGFHNLLARSTSSPGSGHARVPATSIRGFWYQVGTTRAKTVRSHRCPRAPNNRHLSTEIRLIAA